MLPTRATIICIASIQVLFGSGMVAERSLEGLIVGAAYLLAGGTG